MTEEEKSEIVSNALLRLHDREFLTDRQRTAIMVFLSEIGDDPLSDLYDLIVYCKGPA